MKEKNYNIGLDIGVGSVGWCVTDKENNILKANGKNMWGARIFDEAKTAKNRRVLRSARRRLNRRKERIKILKSLLQEDMEKESPNFFALLKESSLNSEDKVTSEYINGIKYNLFCSLDMTDESYYKKYPTIYHLRKHLMESKEKEDFRLVYLVLQHIIKYRGNFLYEGDFSNNINEITVNIERIVQYAQNKENIKLKNDKKIKDFVECLQKSNMTKSEKKEKLIEMFEYEKESKHVIVNIINAILGYIFDIQKIFDVEIEKNKITFSKEIEEIEEIKNSLNEFSSLFEDMNTIYSWFTLQNILNGKTTISDAMIAKYNNYKSDLSDLKKLYKTYLKDEYVRMFRNVEKDNYVAYNGKNCKKCSSEDFFKRIKRDMEKIKDENEIKTSILKKIQDNEFLFKLNTTENAAIPNQLHKKELCIILENQSKYYATLKENKDNIVKLFTFRIPYYIGPLSKKEENWSWIVRNSMEKIRPWNFENVINIDATAEKFIRRMTNKCTYLINEDVLPKQSILYSKFCVLNELNNIRINNRKISRDMKEKLVYNVFCKNKKVTAKMIKDYYKTEGFEVESITGLQDEKNFLSNMSSYKDFIDIFHTIDEKNIVEIENIIYWITIFEDRKILKKKIKKEYENISEEQLNKILKFKYTGWSRLSKKLLCGLKSNDNETIMEKLEKTNMNFMQIINEKDFGYSKKIEDLIPKLDKKIKYKDIDEIPTSPANKRAIWQSICIVHEIERFMKSKPTNIYIEFARSEGEKILKDARPKKILKIYDEIQLLKEYDKNVYLELKKCQSERTLSEKLYLYMIQNGKCLYSQEKLNIEDLDKYEVDHIIPRSYLKDDSIDNKALVLKRENQRKKDSLLLNEDIIKARIEWWKSLLDNGLMSQSKFYKLTKTKMFETDNDKIRFVQRQLVETRQITKNVTNLLINEYKNTNVFALRSELTSNFRKKYHIYKNRNVNNYHHAHDAFILCIIGNTLNKRGYGKEYKYNDYIKKYLKEKISEKQKHGIIMSLIENEIDIKKVKNKFYFNDCYISKMLIEDTGEFYNQTIMKAKDKPSISLKKGKDTTKYGGYTNENKGYMVIFKYEKLNGNREYKLVGLPIKIATDIKNKKITLNEYIKNKYLKDINIKEVSVIKEKIFKNQEFLDENKNLIKLCSDSEVRTAKELVINEIASKYVYIINKENNKINDDDTKFEEENHVKVYEYLLNKLKNEYNLYKNEYNRINEKNVNIVKLSRDEKRSVINGLISLMSTGQGNFKIIGLPDRMGRKSGQNFKTEKLKRMIFINKSITGLYEERYTINGMENNCSNK